MTLPFHLSASIPGEGADFRENLRQGAAPPAPPAKTVP